MNKRFVKSSLLVLSLLLVIPSTGCWSRREINKLGFVGSVAIDAADDSGLLDVTAEIIRPEKLGAGGETSGSSSSSGDKVWLISAKGSTVDEALSKLNTMSADQLFFGQQTSVIIGEQAARKGVAQLLDVFDRMPQLRRTIWIVVTPGKAKSILEAKPKLQGVPSLTIESLFLYRRDSSMAYPSNLNNVLIALSSRSTSPFAARVMTVSSEGEQEENEQEIKLEGGAVFKGDRLVGWLDGQETRGVLWVTNKVKHTTLTVANPQENQKFISFYILSAKRKIRTEMQDQRLTVKIKISCDCNLVEQTSNQDLLTRELKLDKENVSAFESAIASQVKEETLAALKKAQQFQADVFGIGERFYIEHPQEFKEVQKDWPQLFANAEFDITVKAKVRRVGLINRSINAQK
ncbi:MAG: Ger(x)C family spore germination protein [Desulfitobacteriaceae bacterium]